MFTALLIAMTLTVSNVEVLVEVVPSSTLDDPQKSVLAAGILAVFPKAKASGVQSYGCIRDVENTDVAKRNNLTCGGFYTARVTDTEHVDLSIAGRIVKTFDGAPEGFADVWMKPPEKDGKPVLSGTDAWTKQDAFISAAFTGIDATDILDFNCSRDKEVDTTVVCRCAYYDIVNEATAKFLELAKVVHKIIRRVP
jgi:hypothetical protein